MSPDIQYMKTTFPYLVGKMPLAALVTSGRGFLLGECSFLKKNRKKSYIQLQIYFFTIYIKYYIYKQIYIIKDLFKKN